MFQLSMEKASAPWHLLEELTLRHPYTVLQEQVVEAYARYADLAKRYSETSKRQIKVLTKDCLREHSQIADQNVALLKNAIELWRTAKSTSDAVAPMLYHYSWHCLNAFFAYTFFRWEPPHASSHGVNVVPSDDLAKIKIQILHTKNSLFQRLIDTWTLLGVPLAFSLFFMARRNRKIEFTQNNDYLLRFDAKKKCGEISLPELLAFDPDDFESVLKSKDVNKELLQVAGSPGISFPNRALKSYLIFFVASTLARYRPVVWHSILAGENAEKSEFALCALKALLDCTTGSKAIEHGLLLQIYYIFRRIKEGTFSFFDRDGNQLESI